MSEIRAIMAKSSKKGTLAGLKYTDVQTVLEGMRSQIAQALPKHLTAERFIHMTTSVINRNPAIAGCSVQSIVGAMMQASILGFKPVDALGQCYFVPYGGHVQFQIGYKGWMDLARRSGQIKTLYAYVVREGDIFDYELGLDPVLRHKPNSGPENNVTHAYAVAKYKDGGHSFIVLSKGEIERLRTRNASQRGAPSGAWKTDYEAMAKAKAIKQLAKFMPMSDEMQMASISDDGIINADNALASDGSGVNLDAVEYADESPYDEADVIFDDHSSEGSEPENTDADENAK